MRCVWPGTGCLVGEAKNGGEDCTNGGSEDGEDGESAGWYQDIGLDIELCDGSATHGHKTGWIGLGTANETTNDAR